MILPPLAEFLLMLTTLLAAVLFGLTASGHFPADARAAPMRGPSAAVILWVTIVITMLAFGYTVMLTWSKVPWYAGVIGGGGVVLAAPLLLQGLPDSIVDSPKGLLAFSALAVVAALAVGWVAT